MDTRDTLPIDPSSIPSFPIGKGGRIPGLGLGTFGSDAVSAAQVAEAVRYALGIGYRHIDCAAVYGNEREIGAVLEEALKGTSPATAAPGVSAARGPAAAGPAASAALPAPLRREDLWITSKLWNDKHAVKDVAPSFEKSLKDLRLDYLDLYLVHWPFPNFHPPKCDVSSRSPDARPYIHEEYMAVWREFEKLVDRGLVRYIGTSNMTIPKFKLLLADARIKPAANEMELHPHFQQRELFEYVSAQGILPIAYSPLGSPGRPERDRTPEDTVDLEDPVLVKIAKERGVHPASLAIQWAIQRNQVPIPFSVNPRNILANLEAALAAKTKPLNAQEMKALGGIDRNCRLIKGQVFLWEGAADWEDLWDLDGIIPGWTR
jgi:diketogulonate reductase-like aldo/keto reductase